MIRKGKFSMVLIVLVILLAGCENNGGTAQPTGVNDAAGTPSASSAQPAESPAPQPTMDRPKETDKGSVPAESEMGTVTAVRLADPMSGWAGGEGWIAGTDDGGKSWHQQYHGEGRISQLFALNKQEAWAAVSANSGAEDSRSLLSTADGGKHWAAAGKVPNSGFLHFLSSKEAYSANAKTMDGGKTWTRLPVPAHIVGEAYFHDNDHGWAVTQGQDTIEVQSTLNGGRDWRTVMSRKTVSQLNGVVIRSGGTSDAWIECIGGSGMSQTSYSVFHTTDGGKSWQTVIANSTAGAGPAPGFPLKYPEGPNNKGSKPGPLYVVNPKVAFMGGNCPACDKPNTIGWTTDGGKTWNNGKAEFGGYGEALLAIADAAHGWWITTDTAEPSVMYTTSDGGKTWIKAHTFDRPKPAV
jgi:photosystem II stability/assembly factor-like uncharacterized protein